MRVRNIRALLYLFCVAYEAKRHIGITLSGVCLSFRLSGSHTFLVVTLFW